MNERLFNLDEDLINLPSTLPVIREDKEAFHLSQNLTRVELGQKHNFPLSDDRIPSPQLPIH